MKILITGIAGFAGSHLTQYLGKQHNVEVVGLDLNPPRPDFTALLGDATPVVHCCDLADSEALSSIMAEEKPDAVVHLAAMAQVAGAWENAPRILATNVINTQVLMQNVHESSPDARILLVSSSEVYGHVKPQEMPLTESSPLRPNNPYSVSKVSQEFVGSQYHAAFDMNVVIARPFNHIGPRQVGNFVVPSFARQIAEIEAGLRDPVLKVGNLESMRDFTDVRDIVRAYYLLLMKGEAGERYNVASGSSHAISEILMMLLELSTADPKVENIPELMRPSDTPIVKGDCSKLKTLGEWQPRVPLKQSLEDALDFWRQQVRELKNA